MNNDSPKSNIIFFPTTRVREQVEEDRQFEAMNNTDDAITISNYMMDVLQSAFDDLDLDYGLNVDMADPDDPNYDDFSVMLNLMVAILFRRAGMVHVLHDDLKELNEKIKFLAEFPFDDITNEKLFDEFFDNLDDDWTEE